jgi:hypothetical protein
MASERRPRMIRQGLVLVLLGLAIVTVYLLYKGQDRYELEVFQSQTGWGYSVQMNGSPVISQPTIPGIVGNRGFVNEQQARRVGKRVIEKLRQGQVPPTITPAELQQLGVDVP